MISLLMAGLETYLPLTGSPGRMHNIGTWYRQVPAKNARHWYLLTANIGKTNTSTRTLYRKTGICPPLFTSIVHYV